MSTNRPPPRPSRRSAAAARSGGAIVVADTMDKTVVVRVDILKPHPKYKKMMRRSDAAALLTTSRTRRSWATPSASSRPAR